MFDTQPQIKADGKVRCAIYTRKSHEEGLEQEFNSLDAQREAGESYVESQRMQGWIALPEYYDDGGFSGGNMERPGLQKLLEDVDAGKVDVIVVYKIDRLSRSLVDFMKMIEHFNARGVSFVSVTQHFSTTDPTGRMFLGILITFAQYEREVIAERIRDKIAAAKKRGKYCGGAPVLGYDIDHEKVKLLVNPKEARLVRHVFKRFNQLASAKVLCTELNEQGCKTKTWVTKKGKVRSGTDWNTAHIYRVLSNRIYLGEITHKGNSYPGEHEAIVTKKEWDRAHELLEERTRTQKISDTRTKTVASLKGVLKCGHCGGAMGPTYTHRRERRYVYYLCEKDQKRAKSICPVRRISATDVEQAVMGELGEAFRSPTMVAKTYFAAQKALREERDNLQWKYEHLRDEVEELEAKTKHPEQADSDDRERLVKLSAQLRKAQGQLRACRSIDLKEADIVSAFGDLDSLWENLIPAEQNRIVQLLLEKVELRETGIKIEMKTEGLATLIDELSVMNAEATP